MENIQDIKVESNDDLIIKIQSEKPDPEYLIESIKILFNEDLTLKNRHLLINCSNANFQFTKIHITQFEEFLLKKYNCFNGCKIAVLANDPLTTCFFLLIQDRSKQKVKFNLRIFITEFAALKWLNENTKS